MDEWMRATRSATAHAHAITKITLLEWTDEFGTIVQSIATTRCRRRLVEPVVDLRMPHCRLCEERGENFAGRVISCLQARDQDPLTSVGAPLGTLARELGCTADLLRVELLALEQEGLVERDGSRPAIWRIAEPTRPAP